MGKDGLVMIKLFQSFLILTQWLSAIGLVVLILLFLPLSVPRRTRLFASQAMYIVSYVWGVALWMVATAILLNAWGVAGFVIGVLLVGFGSVPLACVACAITGDWLNLGALVLGVLLVFGLRAIALRLLKSVAAQSSVFDAFVAASRAYHAADDAIQSYTTRANHRFAVSRALSACDDDAYDELRVAYTDPADFDDYTMDYLDAHTAAMESLTDAFDAVTAAFATLTAASTTFNRSEDLYSSALDGYKVYCDAYTFAASAYSNAAWCAMTTSLEGNLKAVEDRFQIRLLEARATYAAAAGTATAKANAAAFKAKSADAASKAEQLEQKARNAEIKAKEFLSKAESATVIAERALEASQ